MFFQAKTHFASEDHTLKLPLKTDVCSAALSLYLVILITSASLHLVLLLPVKPRQLGPTKDP